MASRRSVGRRSGVLWASAGLLVAAVLWSCSRPAATQRTVWMPLDLGTDAEFEDLCFTDSLHGWIVGGGVQVDGGLVGRTADGGRTWKYTSGLATREPGVFRFGLQAVEFLNPTRGIVATDGGKIFATDDGGENWRLVRYGRGSADHLFDLDFIDAYRGWAVGLGGVLRTFDGGETWTHAGPMERELTGHAIHFHDEWRGVVAGHQGTLMRTMDGGQTWTPAVTSLSNKEKPYLFDLCFVGDRLGWVVGEQGTILHTKDGGETWTRQETGLPDVRSVPRLERIRRGSQVEEMDLGERSPGLFLTGVRFLDSRRGWVIGHYGYEGRSVVLRTDDGGASWRVEAELPGEELRALFTLEDGRAWTLGDRVRPGRQSLLRRDPDPAEAEPQDGSNRSAEISSSSAADVSPHGPSSVRTSSR